MGLPKGFISAGLFSEGWKNWKTGAIIGLLYGIIGMGYFLFLLWVSAQPNPPDQPILDDPSNGLTLLLIGIVIFLPLFCFSSVTVMIISPVLPVNLLTIFAIGTMPIWGLLLGAVVGRYFEEREKNCKDVERRV